MNHRTAVVTGGAGFIGSHLVDRLIADGRRVLVVDDMSTGNRANLNPDGELHEIDILDPAAGALIVEARPDIVFHLAAQISVAVSTREPLLDARINVLGSLSVMESLRKAGGAKLVFASTGGAIYGEPKRLPVLESAPRRPVSPYAASKLAVEQYLATYRAAYGFDYTVVRLGNVYGPRQDPHGEAGVVAIFSRAMLAGEPVTIFGDGADQRDYVYVSDAVEAIIRASESGGPTAYNVATGIGTSVNRLADELALLTGYGRQPLRTERRAGDLRRVRLSAEKAARELGWRPSVPLSDGLARTVEFFQAELRRTP